MTLRTIRLALLVLAFTVHAPASAAGENRTHLSSIDVVGDDDLTIVEWGWGTSMEQGSRALCAPFGCKVRFTSGGRVLYEATCQTGDLGSCARPHEQLFQTKIPRLASKSDNVYKACGGMFIGDCYDSHPTIKVAPTACTIAGATVIDLGRYEIRTGFHSIEAAKTITIRCSGAASVRVRSTSSSEALIVELPPGPGLSKPGEYRVSLPNRDYDVATRYTIDTNVRTAGPKTASVVYTVTIE
ncbi:TPA: hypothetical protein ACQ301_004396 [Yersinia enterocolitica]